MNGLRHVVLAIGIAVAIFLAVTMSVNLWLTTAQPSEGYSSGGPVPSYTTPQLHP